ncbi:MAG: hypothetical protein B7Y26_06745 [Hydrogenophilales bacterium 16-64-46]|nr:MAG: hypothetical protein B7Z32_07820 [Hydrogenophilales bacterium 12-64-13]OYZ05467.1 MAG: hypothetical protein B7Y26_06745 [Hydrogenophilales bacterium 16-64-46]OZA40047.1 MAG: hypothetical protein B7X87_00130 [Hydrogenophilales bacterium 17-64-34]HQT00913.1 hypothetical protein [Thiobacillus sp.]
MYIIAIGWAYVILLMALTSSSLAKALAIVIFLGVLPIMLFAYAVGGRKRRSVVMADEVADQGDRADPQSD